MRIRRCRESDAAGMYRVINEAARAYQGVIPADCYHEPYMPAGELAREMERVSFYACEDGGAMVGVMGIEPVRDVTLIRHAYVLPAYQRRGIGRRLLDHLKAKNRTDRLLVGTWEAAHWAIAFYEKHGFRRLPDKDRLLAEYWDIPARQIETSTVLGLIYSNSKEQVS